MENTIDFKKVIGDFIFTSRYARYNESLGRRETWEEAIDRVLRMHIKKFSHLSKEHLAEIKGAFQLVKEKKIVPSMRSIQFGGQAIEVKNMRIFNCAALHIHSIRSFAEIFHLLLCGTGVGFSLIKHFLDRLPSLVDKNDKTGTVVTYVVEDTIEGWADSLEALLMCYFKNTAYSGRKISFDYSKIRKKGTPLKIGGGKAPGYLGLKNAHRKIKELLDHIIEDEEHTRLKSIHAYDIIMHASDAVLSGGIRRSACLTLFEPDDEDMMNAKTFITVDKKTRFSYDEETQLHYGKVKIDKKTYDVELGDFEYKELCKNNKINWFHIEPQRGRSNNSVILLRDKTSYDQFHKIIEKTKEFGEPGFVFSNHLWNCCNPCVTGDTLIAVADGRNAVPIKQLAEENYSGPVYTIKDKEVVVGNCSRVWKTQENVEIIQITLDDNSVLKCTPDHEIMLRDRTYIKARDLKKNMRLMSFNSETDFKIKKIKFLKEKQDVYDLTVDNTHNFAVITSKKDKDSVISSGVFVHNCVEIFFQPVTEEGVCGIQVCNLSSINGAKITSATDFIKCAKAATIIGTLQASYTKFDYLQKVSQELTEEEALLGVSITGVMDNPEVLLDELNQRHAADACVTTNKKWAKILGINQAARITCIKPEGTSSLVLESASGIHPHHARKYFRRVQCNKLDPVFKFFKKINPHMVEESVWSANKTDAVITFPIIIDDKAMIKSDLTAVKHLQIIRQTQQNWVIPGTTEVNKKPLMHNVSCTTLVDEHEWNEVAKYIYDNREFFGAVSLLPKLGDKIYKQAPMEEISTKEDEELFNKIVEGFKEVDYTKFKEHEDVTTLMAEAVCAGGSCEI